MLRHARGACAFAGLIEVPTVRENTRYYYYYYNYYYYYYSSYS